MKSPFWGLTKYQLIVYRELAHRIHYWRKSVEDGDYRTPPTFVAGVSCYAGSWQGMALHRMIIRAYERLQRREDWNEIREGIEVDRMRVDDPAGYNTYLLRKEFEQYRKEHADCHHLPDS